jgi:hypothetical protein
MSGWGRGKSSTIGESTSGKSSDMGMVLEDSTEVMRGNTYEQVGSGRDRGSKEKDRCPLTPTHTR